MNPLKIAIVEDEMITAESIKDMLEDLGYEVTGIYIRAIKALEAILDDKVDLALLDINLKGEETGIWLAEQLQKKCNIPYVFLTSYGDKSTIEKAAKTHPFGYLLKPIEKQHLYASIEVAMRKFAELNKGKADQDSSEIILKDALFVKDEYLFVKVFYDEILFVKANGNYLEIHTAVKMHMIKGTLKSFAESLPKSFFIQVHRSYVVNIQRINAIGGNYIKIMNHDIPLGVANKEELISKINLYQKQ